MKGDFSRDTFVKERHYNRVLMQQGRVQLDADWNEMQAIYRHHMETEGRDVIGRCGVPEGGNGFRIDFTTDGKDLTISPGHIYVDGILCELDEGMSIPVSIGEINDELISSELADGNEFQPGQWIEVFSDDSPEKKGLHQIKEIKFVDNAKQILILTLPLDKNVVHKGPALFRRISTYKLQADYPDPAPELKETLAKFNLPSIYLVYLDVWNQHITALDNDRIKEKALGDPDTCTRVKTLWQVKILPIRKFIDKYVKEIAEEIVTNLQMPLGEEVNIESFEQFTHDLKKFLKDKGRVQEFEEIMGQIAQNVGNLIKDIYYLPCDDFEEWLDLIRPASGKLRAHTKPADNETPCYLPQKARYYGPENQLFRVEIHKGGTLKEATFKWSRDNGCVVAKIINLQGQPYGKKLKTYDLGRDETLGFASGQWVEVTDDYTELHGLPGQLIQIEKVYYASYEIDLENAPKGIIHPNPKMRRWDQTGKPQLLASGVKMTGDWQPLENGIEVMFSEGNYKTGDYWLIPARTATGDIEWPPFNLQYKETALQPLGIKHHYCRLALAIIQGDNTHIVKDCRNKFLPLAEPAIHVTDVYIGGVLKAKIKKLHNDDEVSLDNFLEGISIVCDKKIKDMGSSQPNPVCFVTLDIPFPLGGDNWKNVMIGYQPIILASSVKSEGNIIFWKPEMMYKLKALLELLLPESEQQSNQVLAHLTLKGNFIWGKTEQKMYLDGDAFGYPSGSHTRLKFPSGDGRRGGDFEMWFWVIRQKLIEVNLTVSPKKTYWGRGSDGTITLNINAPAGGAKIDLSYRTLGDTELGERITIPKKVVILEGSNKGTFSIKTTSAIGFPQKEIEITASYEDENGIANLVIQATQ